MSILTASTALATPLVQPVSRSDSSGAVWATPHDSYSSSVGVLGCKVNTDRIAYWPGSVDCNNICVSLKYDGRSVKLLRIDSSEGAHDVSYDAWNYLITGYSATKKPTAGGAVAMEFEYLEPSACADLIHTKGHKLPLSASNSINFLASCLGEPDSWVAKNYVLYNIQDAICSWGHDEKCDLDWPNANQPTCSHTLGDPVALTTDPVYNIRYPSGEKVLASSGQVVAGGGDSEDSGARKPIPGLFEVPIVAALISMVNLHSLAAS
ncbi:hypothetical protein F5B22DRAFT_633638 [Xylaria bambusicola]|uniref:uncharacterized protein n=1 Tax=Xylaria bambusicola TaxID=326684 RepID=UPI0020079EF6|nr:uncharacterized protein F5B22DRAFT_633638 [Xylaria bambusicola]KAI0525547.1 hypothetical protein F5B22DRAFT_633638 [Xylaria bambusicola]